MSRTKSILISTIKQFAGVKGEILNCEITEQGLTVSKVRKWQEQLRRAADTLEDLTK